MSADLTRRSVLSAVPGIAFLGLGAPTAGAAGRSAPPVPPSFPAQEPAVVREVVSASHARLERVQELVSARPELAKAAWDWGFGDWESALGAASHMGRRDIAEYLIANGARPNIFTAAMLGDLESVKTAVAARPGIQKQHGPHGITLLRHARAGGADAAAVVAYLEELGDADIPYSNLPLADGDRDAYLGTYRWGKGSEEGFEVELNRRGELAIRPLAEEFPRTLFHQGAHKFHPPGAPSARISFAADENGVHALEVLNPDLVLRAERVAT